MKRRTFVTGAAAAASLGTPLAALAQQTVTLKFHTFMAPLSNVWLLMHKPWMEKVEKESGGRIKFEGYPAMQLGGTPAQLYDQARDGVVDIVWTLPGTTAGRFLLERTHDGHTRLRGRTYYQLDMMPTAYWKLWADDIVHRIHLRVLRHVARLSEDAAAQR